MISIIGTRLDNKACEALEAIFRRIRFEVIDFENCGLEEEVSSQSFAWVKFHMCDNQNIQKESYLLWQPLLHVFL